MRNTTRRRILQGAAGLAAASALMPSPLIAANNPLQIGIVGKVKIPWFDNVAKGVEKAGSRPRRHCLDYQSDDRRSCRAGARDRGLIAKKVDVIGVIPNDAKASSRCWAVRRPPESRS
jgi:simple sugar transport system substrate-binding protein